MSDTQERPVQNQALFELERGIVYAMALCQNVLDGQVWPFPQEDFVRRVHDVLTAAHKASNKILKDSEKPFILCDDCGSKITEMQDVAIEEDRCYHRNCSRVRQERPVSQLVERLLTEEKVVRVIAGQVKHNEPPVSDDLEYIADVMKQAADALQASEEREAKLRALCDRIDKVKHLSKPGKEAIVGQIRAIIGGKP